MSFRSVISNLSMGALALAAASALTSPVHAAAPESNDPIKIALFDWTSVNLNAKILGGILEKLGYTVEYPTADYLSSLTTGLTNGDLDVGLEFWDTTAGEAMKASDATGQTERLGKLGPKAKEEWWFPEYMKEKCPGLPNWETLKDPKCAEAFSTAETAPKGRYLGGPVTWEGFDDERVEALKLPFTVIHAGTDAAMFAELDSAYQRKAPIMLWIYSPHWAPAKYKGEWVEFPEYTPECYTDPKWGTNPDAKYDCGKPHGEIWKYSWSGMKDKWPIAYKVTKAYTIDTDELNKMSGEIDLGGKTPEDVAAAWIAAHEADWKAWAQ
ncbi:MULTISPECIES: ABC transporter substrate-binding protein [unclassified Mesorhizobium]|uniref:ABC transporter substrate-binding protein n=1 Tax=unclassified Mesorhizobium TaxID=325217 RepID=UPI0003CFC9B0|nr:MULTISPECIES: ABC transporter substrate-binding protein [unclassified Mesorhizobium]ESZ09747.1 ABC transporter [Mesorhizobium sp. L2C089B000]WJI50995.1 ABC transporter substrate-binding protein [Mesorhizobium sp. C089B]